jgi:hypothetical protein
MQSLFFRTPSSSSINPAPRDREFIERAAIRRPPTPPANASRIFTRRRRPQQPRNRINWFTRRRRDDRVVPIADDDIFSAPEVEPIPVAMPRQNSGDSNKSGREYPDVIPVDLRDFPETDVASEMPYDVAEIVGIDGRDCCIPGRYAQNCRICPEIMQPRRDRPILMQSINPSAVEPEQKEMGGRKIKRKTLRRGRKKQLKKRHYKKTRKH